MRNYYEKLLLVLFTLLTMMSYSQDCTVRIGETNKTFIEIDSSDAFDFYLELLVLRDKFKIYQDDQLAYYNYDIKELPIRTFFMNYKIGFYYKDNLYYDATSQLTTKVIFKKNQVQVIISTEILEESTDLGIVINPKGYKLKFKSIEDFEYIIKELQSITH